jgi:hypothetical protein
MLTNAMGSKQEQLFKKGLLRRSTKFESSSAQTNSARVVEALADLYHLLEEYGPSWYTEEHRRKAEVALGKEFLIS